MSKAAARTLESLTDAGQNGAKSAYASRRGFVRISAADQLRVSTSSQCPLGSAK